MKRLLLILVASSLLTVATDAELFAQDETVCLQCHAGQSGALAAPVNKWRQSIHSANGISCHDCHGGDPTDFAMAMSPERGFIGVPEYADVPGFCGRCHVGVKQDYDASAHGLAVEEGGAQCVICHNAHDVQKAEIDLINEEDCSRCHAYGRAGEIKAAIVETEQMIDTVEGKLTRLRRLGIAIDQMKGTLFDLRNRYRRLFHSVDVQKVRAETEDFQGEVNNIEQQIADIDEMLFERKLWGGLAVGLILFCGVVSLLIRKTYHDEEGHDA